MLEYFKKWFNKNTKPQKNNIKEFTFISLEDIKKHFANVCDDGFQENIELIEDVKRKIKPNRKNIFILDDVCEITDILECELSEYLELNNKLDKINLIPLCGSEAGFDMISIISNHPEITIDYIITDITFGSNRKINDKKTIIDGVDVLFLSKSVNPNIRFVVITGNILDKCNVEHYTFAKKFAQCLGEPILDHIVFKDNSFTDNIEKYEHILGDL